MLVFTSALIFFGIIHVSIGRAKIYICKLFLITEESIKEFNLEGYLMIHALATNYNMRQGDPEFKDCLLKSMTNIENYYANIDENTNFEAFKAIPYIIHMLGRDYSNDTKSVWISTGIMFKIIYRTAIDENVVKKFEQPLGYALSYFGENCVTYCIKGLVDRSFFNVFPTVNLHQKILQLFLSAIKDEEQHRKAEILIFYLTRSPLQNSHLDIAIDFIDTKKLDFSLSIFSQVAAEITYEKLDKKLDGARLLSLHKYSQSTKLLPKTHLLVMERALYK